MIIFIVIIVIIYLIAVISSITRPTKKNFVNSIIIFVVGLIILAIFFFNRKSALEDTDATPADGFTIEAYNVILDVNKNNEINVTEKIVTDWYESGHHGIYKFTPTWLKYTGKDGKTISRRSEIYDLEAIGEEYTVDTVKKKERIKIGSPYTTLNYGPHEYTIKYTYDMGNDPFKNFDEFIFHAYGDYWGTEIKNASITINMPDNFDSNKIKFFDDKYRKNDITKYVDYKVNGNTITAKVSNNYELYKSLTVDIELPDNYFEQSSDNYGMISLTLCLIIIIFAIISFINWIKHGKDYDKVSQTVEFYPPENLDASEIGYIYGNEASKKLTISLIVELASKGYIKIEEDENNTRTIKKLKEYNRKEKITMEDIYKEINRSISVKLSSNYNEEYATDTEKELIKNMFKDSKESLIKEDFDLFFKNYDSLIKKKYIIVEIDTINDYTQDELNNIKNNIEKRYQSNNELKPLTQNEKCVYDNLFCESSKTILSVNMTFYKAFNDIASNLNNNLDEKIRDTNSYKKMKSTSILFLIGTILWLLSYSRFEDLNPKYEVLYLISFISLFVIVFFMFLMTRKTSYGEMITAKVLGFRNYLETAEKDRIEKLVMENPNYFYDILPYAYALGVSKKWIEKFEDIPIPENDMGNFDYTSMDSFNDLSDSVYTPPSSSGSSSTGGCSSCGGGCSSCGGGCSSCGGGGSW